MKPSGHPLNHMLTILIDPILYIYITKLLTRLTIGNYSRLVNVYITMENHNAINR